MTAPTRTPRPTSPGPHIVCRCGAHTPLARLVGPPGFRTLRCDGCGHYVLDQRPGEQQDAPA